MHTIIISLINKLSAKLSFRPLTTWKLYKIPLQRKGKFPQIGSTANNRIQFSTWLLHRFKLVRNSSDAELKEAEKSQMHLSLKTQNVFFLSLSFKLMSLVKILKSNKKIQNKVIYSPQTWKLTLKSNKAWCLELQMLYLIG